MLSIVILSEAPKGQAKDPVSGFLLFTLFGVRMIVSCHPERSPKGASEGSSFWFLQSLLQNDRCFFILTLM
jgi:hypothetical protein